MPNFIWKGKSRTGAVQEGVLLADNRNAAEAVLRRQNIQITSIKEKGREVAILPRLPQGVSSKRVALFTRQFSVMLDAGLPLVQCLEILIPNSAIRNLIREDKIHQIYGMMQTGQAKHGMQTMNQSLASLYFRRLISLQTAMGRSSHPDELQEIIARGPAALGLTLGAAATSATTAAAPER